MAYRPPKGENQSITAKFTEKPKPNFDVHGLAVEVAAILQKPHWVSVKSKQGRMLVQKNIMSLKAAQVPGLIKVITSPEINTERGLFVEAGGQANSTTSRNKT